MDTMPPLLLSALPRPRTSLVGRERAVSTACDLLTGEAVPLLTLTGVGGVGKTRLALTIAHQAAPVFADGVAFVDLAPLADSRLVLATIASALGVTEAGNRPLIEVIAAALRRRQLLLVLDNCEHLIEAAADCAATLLSACPALQILATSRAALRVRGECELLVEPLTLPGQDQRTASELGHVAAVMLFTQRAHAVDATFSLSDHNAAAVIEICCRLDGLPLAIELAAARMKTLSAEAILHEMTDRLRLLIDGPRDAPPRQRTMRDAIAWSYELLVAEEQAFFRRLAVFAGGFSITAATVVVHAAPPLAVEPLAGIASLVDQSLLRREVGSTGEPRYSMLETIREYGQERLKESGEELAIRRGHADWFMHVAEESWRDIMERFSRSALESMDADRDNIRAALDWLEAVADAAGLLRLAGSAAIYWFARSYRQEGSARLERAIALARGVTPFNQAQIRALYVAGMFARNQGDYARAIDHGNECLAIAHDADDQWGMAMAHALLGYAAVGAGDYAAATHHGEVALRLFEASGDRIQIAQMQCDLGVAASAQGDHERGRALLDASLARSRDIGSRWGMAIILNSCAFVSIACRDHAGASTRFAEALPLWQEFGSRENLAEWLAGVATLAGTTQVPAPALAARLFGSAAAVCEELGHVFALPYRISFEQAGREVRADLGDDTFMAAWTAGHDVPLEHALNDASTYLAGDACEQVVKQPEVQTRARFAGPELTRREREVLDLLCQRLTSVEIATHLFIGQRTVETHTGSIYNKLGVGNRRDAAAAALRLGLI